MLSSEGSTLTNLILARQSLICCAIELDARYEALLAIESARADDTGTPDGERQVSPSQRRAAAELVVLPALIEDLEGQITRAWRRLDRVSPRVLD